MYVEVDGARRHCRKLNIIAYIKGERQLRNVGTLWQEFNGVTRLQLKRHSLHGSGSERLSEMRNINNFRLRHSTVSKNILALIVVGQLAGSFFGLSRSAAQATSSEATSSVPIKNFIFIIQENHSFDNYFGTFPGANSIPKGTALPDYPGGPPTERPFLGRASVHDLGHSWTAVQVAYDKGAMDGFFWAEWPAALRYYGSGVYVPPANPAKVRRRKHAPVQTPTSSEISEHGATSAQASDEQLSPNGFADDEDPDAPESDANISTSTDKPGAKPPPISTRPPWVKNTLSYLDYTVIPNYWAYAQNYTLCDSFFSALEGPSLPNHLYAIAAESGGLVDNKDPRSLDYLFPSIVDLFGKGHVSWTYYVGGRSAKAEGLWNPLPGFEAYEKSSNFDIKSHLGATAQFYKDLKNGTLPQVSYLVPAGTDSEHAPYNVQTGMWYVTGLINAVMQSTYWSKCAVIVVWDDYGGFYDHVPPPRQLDLLGDGFRVPALVISPYSRVGVAHATYDLTSLLKLVETAFGLPPLTERDGSSGSMLECFNFSQAPLPPLIITRDTKLDFSKLQPTSP